MIISQRWVIKTSSSPAGRGKYWVANTKNDSQGRAYIKLTKFDRSFVFFCLGKGMKLGEEKPCSANVAKFDDLITKRKAASIAAVHSALENAGENPPNPPPAKGKKRKIREEDRHLVGDHVVIELDELHVGSQIIGGFGARVLWGLDNSALWIELTATNLGYMKELVKGGQEQKGKSRQLRRLKRFVSSPKAAPKGNGRSTAAKTKAAPPPAPAAPSDPATSGALAAPAAPAIPSLPEPPVEPTLNLESQQVAETLPYDDQPELTEAPMMSVARESELWTDAQPQSPMTPERNDAEMVDSS